MESSRPLCFGLNRSQDRFVMMIAVVALGVAVLMVCVEQIKPGRPWPKVPGGGYDWPVFTTRFLYDKVAKDKLRTSKNSIYH